MTLKQLPSLIRSTRWINFEAGTHPFVRHGGRQRRSLLLEVERLQSGDEQLPLQAEAKRNGNCHQLLEYRRLSKLILIALKFELLPLYSSRIDSIIVIGMPIVISCALLN